MFAWTGLSAHLCRTPAMPVVITRIFIAALVAGAACSSCSKPPTAEADIQNAPHPPVPPREIEACALLTAEEVASPFWARERLAEP